MRRAFIDIGSGTLLLLVVEPDPQAGRGGLRPVVDLCRFGRLGQGLAATGRLAPEAIERSLAACREFRAAMDEVGVASVDVIATQAVREAANAAEFVAPAEQALGAPIVTISGAREAELAARAVAATFPELAGTTYVVVDIGGASTELVVTDGRHVTSAVSVPIGAVRLTEQHLGGDPPTAAQVASLHADIDARLAALELPTGAPIIATAGTATTLAAIDLAMATYDADRVTGHVLMPAQLEALVERITGATVAERLAMPGLVAARADVIAGGAAILPRLVRRLGAPHVTTCDRGIRWGLAFERHAGARPA